jgi:O-antigen/teichoic acid export membrane protein
MERIARIFNWLDMDRAIAYVILAKAWLLFSGPITLYLISLSLTPETQGYYYTFLSLVALQVFIELGFYVVITQFASHEWAHLRFDEIGFIVGDPGSLSRLISLGRLVFKWYAVASLVFIVVVGAIGYFFLSDKPGINISWETPWFIFIFLSGFQLWILPFLSLLEGCGQVANIYKFRLIQAVISACVMWAILFLDGGLWIAVASVGSGLFVNITFFLFKYRNFFKTLFIVSPTNEIIWKTEIWPMQWRLAIGGIVGYFIFSAYIPIMFHYHGPVVAGKMGMTWQAVGVLGPLAMAWISTKVPLWGMLIAQKKYSELDQSFYRASSISLAVITLGALVIWLIVYGLNYIQHPISERILSPLATAVFSLGFIALQVLQCLSSYLRAHKKEPFLYISIGSGLTTGLLVWVLGSKFGPIGAGASFLLVSIFTIPFGLRIWHRCRYEWHRE